MEKIIEFSPTDAKIYYNLSLLYAKNDEDDKAISAMETAVNLKGNYKEARYALGMFYKKAGRRENAKQQFEYILKFIAPKDENIKKQLENL